MSQYLLAALDAGVPDHVMHVIVGEGVYASMFGGVDAERKVAALRPRVYELAEQVGTPESAMRRRFFDAMTSFLLGHWKQVLQPTREASEMVAPGNALKVEADGLTLADSNEEGANLLALQTRQQLSTTALSLASQASQAVLRLFQ